jgi:hypothetical protein
MIKRLGCRITIWLMENRFHSGVGCPKCRGRRAKELSQLVEARTDFEKEFNVLEWKIPTTFASLPFGHGKMFSEEGVSAVLEPRM